ncbi:HAMP domain-containing protein [Candidatus Hakubella thermalkaliphila]
MDTTIKRQEIAIAAYGLGGIIVFSIALSIILWKFVSIPVRTLIEGTKRVAAGELDYVVEIKTKDEMGELARAFNAMTTDLSRANKELIEWGNTLEKRVKEKTEEIKKGQLHLVHSQKLASLGRINRIHRRTLINRHCLRYPVNSGSR